MLKLNKVTRELFDHENTEQGYYVSIRFRRGMWDVYISDDFEGRYTCKTFPDFLPAHTWADAAIDRLDITRCTGISFETWMD